MVDLGLAAAVPEAGEHDGRAGQELVERRVVAHVAADHREPVVQRHRLRPPDERDDLGTKTGRVQG